MANEFIARNGVFALNNSQVTGSLAVSAGITGNLTGNVVGNVTGNLTGTASTASFVAASSINGTVAVANGGTGATTTTTINGTSINYGTTNTITAATPNALTIGTGLSGTSYNGSAAVTITNTGVTSNVAGSGISVSGATGAVTITNTGVTSAVAGTGVSVSAATGAVTISIGQSVATSATPSFDQVLATNNGNGTNFKIGDDSWLGDINVANTCRIMGIQTAANGYIVFGNSDATALGRAGTGALTYGGSFTATGDVTAFSDARVKENIETITDALSKVLRLRGVTYNRTDIDDKSQKIGFIAQEVQQVVPQVITEENDRLSLAYGNLGGLFVEAFKEQQKEIEKNKAEILELREIINTLVNK